jgi:cell division protein FtsW
VLKRADRPLLFAALGLTFIGFLMVFSAGSFSAFIHHSDSLYFLKQQVVRTAIGLGALLLATRISMRWLEERSVWLLAIACAMLLLVIAMGHMSNGATRWLRFGVVSLQPTDIARLVAVVFLAAWLKRRPIQQYGFWKGMMLPLVIIAGVCGLILKQPNLSSAAMLFLTAFGMMMLAGAPWRYLLIPLGVGALGAAGAVFTHPYMMTRVKTFLGFIIGGHLDQRGAGWQLDQSLIAIGSGGVLGRGLGGGMQKLLYLPEAHTDFIFSIIAEELGLWGVTLLFAIMAVFLLRGLRAAARASDPFASLVAGGLTLQIGLYALANLAVATGLAPTTGLPFPFVSYGGSALMVNLAAVGIILRVSAMNSEEDALARQRWSREAA